MLSKCPLTCSKIWLYIVLHPGAVAIFYLRVLYVSTMSTDVGARRRDHLRHVTLSRFCPHRTILLSSYSLLHHVRGLPLVLAHCDIIHQICFRRKILSGQRCSTSEPRKENRGLWGALLHRQSHGGEPRIEFPAHNPTLHYFPRTRSHPDGVLVQFSDFHCLQEWQIRLSHVKNGPNSVHYHLHSKLGLVLHNVPRHFETWRLGQRFGGSVLSSYSILVRVISNCGSPLYSSLVLIRIWTGSILPVADLSGRTHCGHVWPPPNLLRCQCVLAKGRCAEHIVLSLHDGQ